MKDVIKNQRREFLSKSIKGTVALGIGMSSVTTLLQSFTTDEASTGPEEAKTDAEYRLKLAPHAMLSMVTSQLAVEKASNAKVKMFANFELAETKAVTKILKEMGTTMPAMDAKAKATLASLKAASGTAFDKAYIGAQVTTHEILRNLTADYLKNAEGKTSTSEMHGRHIASLALATITEHITLSKMIKSELSK